MICEACKAGMHPECTNTSTCPCQHRRAQHMSDGSCTPLSDRDALLEDHRPLPRIVQLMMTQEAVASVNLDRTGDGQTFTIDGPRDE
jgi:hypothetical protein